MFEIYRNTLKKYNGDGDIVIIPEGVEIIGCTAFYRADSVREIVLPVTLKKIMYAAFSDMKSLEIIRFPKDMQGCVKFDGTHVTDSNNFKSFEVEEGNRFFCSEDGVLFDKKKETLLCYPSGKEGTYVVPHGVKAIGDSAFIYRKKITDIVFPETLETIESEAFRDCTNLKDFVLPSKLSIIRSHAFSGCDNLKEIYIPSGVALLDEDGYAAFAGSKISRFTVSSDNSFYSSRDGILYDKTQRVLLRCPESTKGTVVVPEGVEEIFSMAFSQCREITEVILPSSLNEIGYAAFADCESIREMYIPDNVKTIGEDTFEECTGLRKIRISNGVTELPGFFADGCEELKEVEFGENIKKICCGAFYCCDSLKKAVLPKSLDEFDPDVFGDDVVIFCRGEEYNKLLDSQKYACMKAYMTRSEDFDGYQKSELRMDINLNRVGFANKLLRDREYELLALLHRKHKLPERWFDIKMEHLIECGDVETTAYLLDIRKSRGSL